MEYQCIRKGCSGIINTEIEEPSYSRTGIIYYCPVCHQKQILLRKIVTGRNYLVAENGVVTRTGLKNAEKRKQAKKMRKRELARRYEKP